MSADMNSNKSHDRNGNRQAGASEAVYGLGLLGAWYYYITTATTFWLGALGIVKGIFWPAILVYEILKFLG